MNFVLALYDFASKQEYIYRTSKIKEISGASQILDGMYQKFVEVLRKKGIEVTFRKSDGSYFDFGTDFPDVKVNSINKKADGQVLYEGGGKLLILFQSKEIYINANKILSMYLLQNYPGLHMISSCANYTGKFSEDVAKLFREYEKQKNRYPASELTAVTPMTQIDPMTFLPVTEKFSEGQAGNPYPTEVSLSADRYAKAKKYNDNMCANKASQSLDAFEEGLTAVIYIDGNSMGEKLESIAAEDYETGVNWQREFSDNVRKTFVGEPIKKLEEEGYEFRRVIAGGDEITLICKAEDALKITKSYFEYLIHSDSVLPDGCGSEEQKKNTSCAGICVIHAKSPFVMAYEQAEAACENAKRRSRKSCGNYFDFYYIHAGMSADFDVVRKREQYMTCRPYAVSDIDGCMRQKADILKKAGRSNVKALGIAAQKGEKEFMIEVLRVNAYLAQNSDPSDSCAFRLEPEDREIVYDIAEFYDLWFADSETEKEVRHEADY